MESEKNEIFEKFINERKNIKKEIENEQENVFHILKRVFLIITKIIIILILCIDCILNIFALGVEDERINEKSYVEENYEDYELKVSVFGERNSCARLTLKKDNENIFMNVYNDGKYNTKNIFIKWYEDKVIVNLGKDMDYYLYYNGLYELHSEAERK